jgi:hypothetical protein
MGLISGAVKVFRQTSRPVWIDCNLAAFIGILRLQIRIVFEKNYKLLNPIIHP